MKFHEKIICLRKARGLRKSDIARFIQIHPSNMTKFEKGLRIPKTCILLKMAEFFNIHGDILLNDSIDKLVLESGEVVQIMT